jgi:hypothetical protein
VIPGAMLLTSAGLLAYRGFTEENHDHPLNGFLANILLQMMPLIALKAKIWSCNDRVSLVPLVLCKTLLMHVTLGFLRILSTFVQGYDENSRLTLGVDIATFLGALAVLKWEFEFPMNPLHWIEHQDVRNLVVLAGGAAFCSHAFFVFLQPSWMSDTTRAQSSQGLHVPSVLFTFANYVDIIAFMPVVWRLYQAEELDDCAMGATVSLEARRQVRMFFLFVVAFYSWDDVIDPIMTLLEEPLAMMAHAAHFMLLLDFAGFFIFQVGQPTTVKEHGDQLQGLLSKDDDDDDHC